MDTEELNNIAVRKGINIAAANLREKCSRNTAKAIKLRVAQDTAYWDLKEKLQQVEGNHERLQQNMVDVQMQHETLSGQYQDELRLRPEILNRLSSTRKICDVLEEYSERLKQTVLRCKADQVSLSNAYQASGQLVRDIKARHLQNDEKNQQLITSLKEQVNQSEEHKGQLLQMVTCIREQFERERNTANDTVATAQARSEELMTTVNALNGQLNIATRELAKKEEYISKIQDEMKELVRKFNAQNDTAREMFAQKEKELKEALEANSALKRALTHQEHFHTSESNRNATLEDKIASLEEEHAAAYALIERLKSDLEEASTLHDKINKDMKTLIEDKHDLMANMKQKEELLENLKQEVQKKTDRIQELADENKSLQNKIIEINNNFNHYKKSTEEQIEDLTKKIEINNHELDQKASAITGLMSELKTSTDVRNNLENALQKSKNELQVEKENNMEKDLYMGIKLKQLQATNKAQEAEISKQMSLISEIRSEKERLQDTISSMQSAMDNIQKQLTGRAQQNKREPAEQPDDNAVMLTPTTHMNASPLSPMLQNKAVSAVPRSESSNIDSLLNTFYSDSSSEGNRLDKMTVVNQRYAAISRGEPLPPIQLPDLKRKHRTAPPATPATPATSATNTQPRDSVEKSSSKVKNDQNKERLFFKSKRQRIIKPKE